MSRFTHAAPAYAAFRPSPPEVLADLLLALAATSTPDLVVDLGSGTGLSTRFWAPRATRVIGVEPSAAIRERAERRPLGNVTYQEGDSAHTKLPAAEATLVTAAQALHWMDPAATFAEAKRILQPGGVFAAYDYAWPPTTGIWQIDAAYAAADATARALERVREPATAERIAKTGHLQRMHASGAFRAVRELTFHGSDAGTPDRLLGCLLSQSHVANLLAAGTTDAELGLDAFRKVIAQHPSTETPWHWSYTMQYGIV